MLFLQGNLAAKGVQSLELSLPFNEKATIERSLNYVTRSLEVFSALYLCITMMVLCIMQLVYNRVSSCDTSTHHTDFGSLTFQNLMILNKTAFQCRFKFT